MKKKEIVNIMKSNLDEVVQLIEDNGYEPVIGKNNNLISCFINGIKTEYQISAGCLRVGYSNSLDDIRAIGLHVLDYFEDDVVNNALKNWVDIKLYSVEDYETLIDCISSIEFELESPSGSRRSRSSDKGVLFEGSNFSNAHERATTIGPRFMNMVCKASGMDLFKMDAEWGTDDAGRIDGVEMDETEKFPVSIYECQSGIQNGSYLDDEHLNKSLLRYPSDPEIAPTLKKIVILAGGYSKEHLTTIKWQSELLKTRDIEVILLKTIRVEDKIGVEVVNYQDF